MNARSKYEDRLIQPGKTEGNPPYKKALEIGQLTESACLIDSHKQAIRERDAIK